MDKGKIRRKRIKDGGKIKEMDEEEYTGGRGKREDERRGVRRVREEEKWSEENRGKGERRIRK